jgi:hypothetical protein
MARKHYKIPDLPAHARQLYDQMVRIYTQNGRRPLSQDDVRYFIQEAIAITEEDGDDQDA